MTRARMGRLCRELAKRYGRPNWYTPGQVKTAADFSGQTAIADFALCIFTAKGGFDRQFVRDRFRYAFMRDFDEYSAREVVARFAPPSYRGDGHWPNRFVHGSPRF